MLKEYQEQGLWDDTKEKNLEALPALIEEMSERVDNESRNRVKRQKLEKWLVKLNTTYAELLYDRNTRLSNSAEYIAHDSASLYLLWSSVRQLNGDRLWPTFEDIESDQDIVFIEELISFYIGMMQDLPEAQIRAIARTSMWRIRWSAFKRSSIELFGRHSQNLSNDQFMLVHWSQVYDSVYESLERPPEEVVLDDKALDEWLLEQNEKYKREVGQRYHGKGVTKGNSKIDNASEVFKIVTGEFDTDGVWHEYTEEERWAKIERIRNLNSPLARKIKSNEEERLRDTPGQFIQEHELRKSRDHREAMGGKVTNKRR